MNVSDLIHEIERRPGAFVGTPSLESLYFFICGFLYNNIVNENADDLDMKFKNEFHDWVKEFLESRYNIRLELHRNYVYYINQVYCSNEQKIEVFFSLCRVFFGDGV